MYYTILMNDHGDAMINMYTPGDRFTKVIVNRKSKITLKNVLISMTLELLTLGTRTRQYIMPL
jgi:hypothetical protein